ncbi:MAG: hypothetical protein A3F46_06385 [Legionellales bacterium RIFCSPHIGHO2_12_FULL_42_9]|nr:MAG: hypothetical protein A3F46_06385 [Legionellales bacterium RIFCSPHIGHO2_12_FULL_42_9]
MAKTPSNMLALGTLAPLFSLPNVLTQQKFSLTIDPAYKATLIMFICNHCPYVKQVNPELVRLANDYQEKKVRFIAINSNDVANYPDDSPQNMRKTALAENYPFSYLYDETQEVARAYQAACTPDFYLFDANLILVYRGQLDDARPGNQVAVNGMHLRKALNQVLSNTPVTVEQKPSLGCNIKWK